MKNINVDLVIIGGGPAGIAAGIYAAMDGVNYLLIEAEELCWFMETSINSHNFVDGFTGAKGDHSGTFLKKSFIDHFKRVGGKILKDTVLSLNKKANYFILITKDKRIIAKTVIITSGTTPKTLKIKSEFKFNEEVHYNCVTDGAKYIGKKIVVVGGRNSGAVAACYLSDLGCKVSIIEIKSELQAKKKYINSLAKRNIDIYTSTIVNEMIGGKKLERIKISIFGIEKEIETDAIFCILDGIQ
jgi:thioredoxin reductase (NADPH)